MTGKVRRLHGTYGFLYGYDNNGNWAGSYFFHASTCVDRGTFQTLTPGTHVRFDVDTPGERGLRARNVERLRARPDNPYESRRSEERRSAYR